MLDRKGKKLCFIWNPGSLMLFFNYPSVFHLRMSFFNYPWKIKRILANQTRHWMPWVKAKKAFLWNLPVIRIFHCIIRDSKDSIVSKFHNREENCYRAVPRACTLSKILSITLIAYRNSFVRPEKIYIYATWVVFKLRS